jgi:UDP-N-acetylmuramate: L-alanyl-gamma-D-glutamyl-meso-diaminopimelate ligase
MTSSLQRGGHVYFMGIAGTGMAAVAGLCQEAGYKVTGSEQGEIYPPMSTMLDELRIPVAAPYAAKNVEAAKPDMVVVANALSRGNPEIEHVLAQKVPHTSFPALLGEYFLEGRTSIVVAGTHGKTTTSSLMAHVLHALGEEPGFMIGGIPKNFPRSFRLGKGSCFVIEGDEYDTAFFDKGPKFLHYRPKIAILNNVEFDHADIYANVEAIEKQFVRLASLVNDPSMIIANVDDAGVRRVLAACPEGKNVTRVATLGQEKEAFVRLLELRPLEGGGARPLWQGRLQTRRWGEITVQTTLEGSHNMANVTQVVATIDRLAEKGLLRRVPTAEDLGAAIRSFEGVKRRLDHLGCVRGIDVFEDFAHHPTAVKLLIENFRRSHPGRNLWVAFDPRNATSRRNIFENDYVAALGLGDRVLIGPVHVDHRIPEAQRMNTKNIERGIGTKAKAFDDNDELLATAARELKTGDAIIFMSSGSFNGIQHQLVGKLQS